jgi:hypothetical protein
MLRTHNNQRDRWPMLRRVGNEYHFEIEGKWGVKK